MLPDVGSELRTRGNGIRTSPRQHCGTAQTPNSKPAPRQGSTASVALPGPAWMLGGLGKQAN